MSFFRIIDIPGMKDLIIKGRIVELYETPTSQHYGDGVIESVEVEEILNPDVIIGDRQLKFPVVKGFLHVNLHAVREIDDPGVREFTTQSPFGKYQYDGSYKKFDIVVTYVRYENGISVTISEDRGGAGRTLYSQNFYNERADEAEETVQQALRNDIDIEDLVMELKAFE